MRVSNVKGEDKMKSETGDKYCRIQNEQATLIFRFDELYINTPVEHQVRGWDITLSERKFYNRIDVNQIENGHEVYKSNFIWTNCKNKNDFQRECENYFLNWTNLNRDFKAMRFETLPDEKPNFIYEDKEHECFYATLNEQTLVFIPQQAKFDTQRINVFQILQDKVFVYRSNFQMNDIQGKDDFIASCIKYFYIWFKVNQQHNTFLEPIFNPFPWKAEADNPWWEFDKWAEMNVFTPRTLCEEAGIHPLISPFLLWKQTEGFKVSLRSPGDSEMAGEYCETDRNGNQGKCERCNI
jgi:hypothetical protein